MVSGAVGGNWRLLRSALTTSVDGLVVADFDGDGYADVARSNGLTWEYAARGWGGFVTLRSASLDQNLGKLPVGQFRRQPRRRRHHLAHAVEFVERDPALLPDCTTRPESGGAPQQSGHALSVVGEKKQ
jgi:hypothetical protein